MSSELIVALDSRLAFFDAMYQPLCCIATRFGQLLGRTTECLANDVSLLQLVPKIREATSATVPPADCAAWSLAIVAEVPTH